MPKTMKTIEQEFVDDRAFFEDLLCPLSPAEWATKGELLAKKVQEIAAYKEQAKNEAKAAAEHVKQLESELKTLTEEVRSHQEERPVRCHEVPNPRGKFVEVVRLDTGEVVRTRAMTPSEADAARQEALPFAGMKDDDEEPNGGAERRH